ncbi:hypothetical protein GCM10011414_16060 [Croceivirga lutea]|nr:hypothetical protein GCM10011414_16060 [Croceivirga lutea]
MIVPKAITNPIPESVLPNPLVIASVISRGCNPKPNPEKIAAKINEITGCTLNLMVANTIKITTRIRTINSIKIKLNRINLNIGLSAYFTAYEENR